MRTSPSAVTAAAVHPSAAWVATPIRPPPREAIAGEEHHIEDELAEARGEGLLGIPRPVEPVTAAAEISFRQVADLSQPAAGKGAPKTEGDPVELQEARRLAGAAAGQIEGIGGKTPPLFLDQLDAIGDRADRADQVMAQPRAQKLADAQVDGDGGVWRSIHKA